jgi:transcriptional regulator with GAF, ATPase, and Fis domain
MRALPSRAALASLSQAASAVAPHTICGFARHVETARVSILYAYVHGVGEYLLDLDETPHVLRPSPDAVAQHADADTLAAHPDRAIEWHMQFAGVRHLVSVPVRGFEPTRFWVGFSTPTDLTPDQLRGLQAVADASADLLGTAEPPEQEVERLHRLELTAGLLPALVRVLDVRDVFSLLSVISREALPHDSLTLGLFNDDLTTITLYAQTEVGREVGRVFPQPYPAAFTRAWDFDILDDRTTHPLERDRPVTKLGMRSSVRLAIRFDDRLIGGLSFNSREPNRYTMLDVAVGRRLTDHVAVAISHQRFAERLAEQARRHEELRAEAARSDMLDQVLASLTSMAELPEVFDRISNVIDTVLAHDTLFLAVVSPGSLKAKIYAAKSGPKFPELVPVPPALAADPNWEFDIVDDLKACPDQQHLWTAQNGYRSTLRVPIRLDNEFVGGLNFASFEPSRYTPAHVPIARRVADRLTLNFARERGAALLRRADEATERAARLEARVRALTEELDARTGYRRVVGESAEWRQVLTQATQVAATETTVLLLGESGTGKEVIARFVHRASPRHHGPFVALNCAALPEQLLEAELFGYERGAYTGATQSKPGRLEQAAGGTLFLDEVGEMSLPAQAKFLRVLQEREFQRLGGTRTLRADARIIAATNRDLPRAIAQGQFREDLYYRLHVFAIPLPALRDRRADVVPLSEAFLAEIGQGIGRPPAGISRDARQALVGYHWPGNVRELRNVLERAAILCDGGLITADHLALNPLPIGGGATPAVAAAPLTMAAGAAASTMTLPPVAASLSAPLSAPVPARPTSAGDLQSMERQMIEDALQRARFNKSKAAKALGLTRQQLYLRLRKYSLE